MLKHKRQWSVWNILSLFLKKDRQQIADFEMHLVTKKKLASKMKLDENYDSLAAHSAAEFKKKKEKIQFF